MIEMQCKLVLHKESVMVSFGDLFISLNSKGIPLLGRFAAVSEGI